MLTGSGAGTVPVALKVRGAFRAKLRQAQRLDAFIEITASDAAGVRADPPRRRLVLRR